MAALPVTSQHSEQQGPIWIFGYGSLVHTPNFEFSQRVTGYIKGWRRVFWQGSTDHRGTPQRPGRTVTITAASDDEPDVVTWGAAFQLAGTPEEQAATLSYLEWREKEYDVRRRVDVYGSDGAVAVRGALVYIASPTNSNYLGPAEPRDIATQIATCRGPSGPNWEYLFRLADAMRAMAVPDPELYGLEELVRQELARLAEAAAVGGAVGAEAAAAGATTMVAAAAALAAVGQGQEEQLEEVLVEEFEHHVDFRRRHQRAQQLAQAAAQHSAGAAGGVAEPRAAAVAVVAAASRAGGSVGAAATAAAGDCRQQAVVVAGSSSGGDGGAGGERPVFCVQAVCGQNSTHVLGPNGPEKSGAA